jgi:hypothetical protein
VAVLVKETVRRYLHPEDFNEEQIMMRDSVKSSDKELWPNKDRLKRKITL